MFRDRMDAMPGCILGSGEEPHRTMCSCCSRRILARGRTGGFNMPKPGCCGASSRAGRNPDDDELAEGRGGCILARGEEPQNWNGILHNHLVYPPARGGTYVDHGLMVTSADTSSRAWRNNSRVRVTRASSRCIHARGGTCRKASRWGCIPSRWMVRALLIVCVGASMRTRGNFLLLRPLLRTG